MWCRRFTSIRKILTSGKKYFVKSYAAHGASWERVIAFIDPKCPNSREFKVRVVHLFKTAPLAHMRQPLRITSQVLTAKVCHRQVTSATDCERACKAQNESMFSFFFSHGLCCSCHLFFFHPYCLSFIEEEGLLEIVLQSDASFQLRLRHRSLLLLYESIYPQSLSRPF